MAVHETKNGFVISSRGSWVPGVYEDRRAANYAFRFGDDNLQSLQDTLNGGMISFEMLQDLRRILNKRTP
jgi:hypothetical protein